MRITATLDYDYGCVNISISGVQSGLQVLYLLRYTNNDDNPAELIAELNSSQYSLYKDALVEQGERYKYAVYKSLNTSDGSTVTNDWVYVDFEDIFLSDRNCSLRIKFNPQISSFKNIIQEQKIETIGNRYPFFFRNGQLQYREMPISGLISTEMDEYFAAALFEQDTSSRSSTAAGAPSVKTQRETYYNERKFREKVEEWLNNGQPKVFRSPTEGNYILRLMNISMTPNQQLSRKLYSFNATGYEIAEYNIENLIEAGMLPVRSIQKVGEVASYNTWGKVYDATDFGSTTRNANDELEINQVDITNVIGTTNVAIGGGDVIESPVTYAMTRAASNENIDGLVMAKTGANYFGVEGGVPKVNTITLDKISPVSVTGSVKYLKIGGELAPITTTPSGTVKGKLGKVKSSDAINKVKVTNGGYMTINSISIDKLIQNNQTIRMVIGGGGL